MTAPAIPTKKISLSRIHYFYMTWKAGSMRAASDLLNVAPSSISRQISLLEQEVGLPLIEHGSRSIKLTEAGDQVINYYREEMALEETLRENLDDLRGMRRGRILVAMGEGFVSLDLSEVIAEYLKAHTGMQINVVVAATNDLVRMISEDEVHFGLTFETHSEPRLSRRLSLDAPIRLITAPDHPLAKKSSISLKDLSGEMLALPVTSFRIRQMLLHAESREGIYLTPSFTSNSLALLKGFALSGKGVTIMPRVGAISELSQGSLVDIPIDSPLLSDTTINLVTRRGRQLSPAILSFINLVAASLSQWLSR